MDCSRSWTDESRTSTIDSSENQESKLSRHFLEKKHHRNRSNKISSKEFLEQIIVHRWLLPDIQSLSNQKEGFYLQFSPFGCTGEDEFLQWLIRFYPIAPPSSEDRHPSDSIDQHTSLREADNSSALENDTNIRRISLTYPQNAIDRKSNQHSSLNTEFLNGLFHEIL